MQNDKTKHWRTVFTLVVDHSEARGTKLIAYEEALDLARDLIEQVDASITSLVDWNTKTEIVESAV